MMTEFTKGPWVVDEQGDHWSDNDEVFITGNPTGLHGGMRRIAFMDHTWSKHQSSGNAQLMAAAPEMYDYLLCLKEGQEHQCNKGYGDGPDSDLIKLLAKARGES